MLLCAEVDLRFTCFPNRIVKNGQMNKKTVSFAKGYYDKWQKNAKDSVVYVFVRGLIHHFVKTVFHHLLKSNTAEEVSLVPLSVWP